MTRHSDSDSDSEVAAVCRSDDDSRSPKRCATCGAAIDPTARHPAATAPDGSGVVYLFCSTDCRTVWTAEATE
ncbi:DUF7576 family protein [Halogeometricum limi]|uniref:MYM-type Zinc finger with FCS sequence motif-containing protein n=1 Tax=Halogeometricum limi TaxID=555875 RepID=A0A1I6FQD8_9EURY|nr:hypothetical protein [Halogeometricum limi]SFR32159.1 MYM-type Zinc finger with FCS sequence motif-containing protein [Halogeometricum limi]